MISLLDAIKKRPFAVQKDAPGLTLVPLLNYYFLESC